MPRESMRKCPRCGFEPPKGKKTMLRLWITESTDTAWEEFAKNYDTPELALIELLRRGKLFDTTQRSRIAIDTDTGKRGS